MKFLSRIGLENKITLMVSITLLIGITISTVVDIRQESDDSLMQQRDKSESLAEVAARSIQNVMLLKKGEEAQSLIDNIRAVPQVERLRIYNRGGAEAFSSQTKEYVVPIPNEKLAEVLSTGRQIEYYDYQGGHGSYIVLKPLPNAQACQQCHENQAVVQGVVEVSSSIEAVEQAISNNKIRMVFLALASILALALLLRLVLRVVIINPLEQLMAVIREFSSGHLGNRVAVRSGDEVGMLAASFNTMAENLQDSQQELQLANAELQRANRLKSEFLANMSHELRTPLNAIIGFSELMQNQLVGSLNEKQTRYLSNIHVSGAHLLQLINDILDLAKIEAGKVDLRLEAIPLGETIESSRVTILPLANKKNTVVRAVVPAPSVMVVADSAKLKQVLYNLLSNAVKFTPEGGRVTIQTNVVGEFVEILVIDTGIGIAPLDRERIFEEFHQVDGSYTRRYEGTGLGLSLTRRLVMLQGGRIWVRSQLGSGSVFGFTVPLAPNPAKGELGSPEESKSVETTVAADSQGLDPVPGGPSPLVLVVEDDQSASDLLAAWLQQEGYRVAQAFDGLEALTKAKELNPFVVVLDIMLPLKDGWAVLKELKEDPLTRDIPVVVVSALDERERGFALGAMDYLTKPIDCQRLTERLSQLSLAALAKSRPTSALVVDDHPESVELVKEVFEAAGIEVFAAYGGREAVQMATENLPDIIILDLMMPEMNGFEVISELRRHPMAQNIPVIILTAKDLTDDDRQRLDGKVRRIVQKQRFSIDELLGEIMRLEVLFPNKTGMDDKLTGLLNHSGFERHLNREISRARRHDGMVSVVLIELGFQIETADDASGVTLEGLVKDVADLLRHNLRIHDLVARYDREQFVVLLPQISKKSAIVVAQKLANGVSRYGATMVETQPNVKIVVRCGVAAFPEDAAETDDLMAKVKNAAARVGSQNGAQVSTN